MMKTLISVLLLLAVTPCYSQKVSGYVRDAETEETLIGVSVVKKSGARTITNQQGYYSINVEEADVLSFHHYGYKTVEIPVSVKHDTLVNVFFEQQVFEIGEVNIIGRSSLVRSSGLGNVAVNMSQLKYAPLFLGEQDVFKFLQLLPGVSLGREGSSGLNIRGGSSDQSLILLDDVPLYNQAHTFGFLSIFSGDAVKSAELFKGYVPAEYGGRLSGVVSMRMRDGNRNEHRQAITVGTISAGLTLEGPIVKGRGSYLVSARKFTPDLFLRGYYLLSKPETRVLYNFYDVTGKATFDLNGKNTLFLSFYNGYDMFNVKDIQKENGKEIATSGGGFSWGNTMASLRLNTSLNSGMFMNNTLYYSRQNNAKDGDVEVYDEKYKFESKMWSAMDEVGIRSVVEHNVSDNYNLTYGASGSVQYFNPRNISANANGNKRTSSYNTKNLYTGAMFIGNNIKWNSFEFNAGLRGAYYNNNKLGLFSIEPRLSVSAAVSDDWSVWASYTHNSQPVMSAELHYAALPLDFWTPFSERYLQRSRQVSLGMRTSALQHVVIIAEAYYKPLKNIALIHNSDDYMADDGGVDISTGEAYGAELNAQYRKNRLGVNMSYAYSRSFRTVGGKRYWFEYDTPHVLNVFANYDVIKREGRTQTMSLNVSYKSGIPFIFGREVFPTGLDFETEDPSDVGRNIPKYADTRLPDYFRIDLSYNMEKVKKNGVRNWQFSILNLTNQQNPYVVYPALNVSQQKINYKQLTLIPFMPTISYRRTF
jgi:hypothetical protein